VKRNGSFQTTPSGLRWHRSRQTDPP
jgi:hypothetical protein